MNRGSILRSSIAIAALFLIFSSALEAQINLMVSRSQTDTLLPSTALFTNRPVASNSLQWSEPAYGQLSRVQEGLIYEPTSEFWSTGFDSFQVYSASPRGLSIGETIFLIADLKLNLVQGGMLDDCIFGANWSIGGPRTDIPLQRPNPTAPCYLEFPLGQNSASYVHPNQAQTGPGGGNTTVSLDPGGNGSLPPFPDQVIPAGVEVGFAAGVTAGGERLFEIVLEEGPVLIAQALQSDGTIIESAPIPITEAHDFVELNWWFATSPGASDGGAILVLDGEVVATVSGVDNFGFLGQEWEWRFGTLDPSVGAVGGIGIRNAWVWESPATPIYEVLFANSAGTLNLDGWKNVESAARVRVIKNGPNNDPEYHLEMNGGGQSVSLQDGSASGKRHFRANFEVGVDQLQPWATSTWILMSGDSHPLQGRPLPNFQLKLRYDSINSRYLLRAVAGEFGGKRLSPWRPLPNNVDRLRVSLQWWSGRYSGQTPGELRVNIPGMQPIYLPNLNNYGLTMGDTSVGAMEIPFGMQGSMTIDDFYVWH